MFILVLKKNLKNMGSKLFHNSTLFLSITVLNILSSCSSTGDSRNIGQQDSLYYFDSCDYPYFKKMNNNYFIFKYDTGYYYPSKLFLCIDTNALIVKIDRFHYKVFSDRDSAILSIVKKKPWTDTTYILEKGMVYFK
jgi:hypothetical protein